MYTYHTAVKGERRFDSTDVQMASFVNNERAKSTIRYAELMHIGVDRHEDNQWCTAQNGYCKLDGLCFDE